MEPLSPALAGRYSTTGSPGKAVTTKVLRWDCAWHRKGGKEEGVGDIGGLLGAEGSRAFSATTRTPSL